MKEEILGMGLVRIRDVDEAQMLMISTTKGFLQKGEIKIQEQGSEEEYI